MNSRERFIAALEHREPDRPPLDLGATSVTGIHALALHRLRKSIGQPERPVVVYEVLQQLGLVDEQDIAAMHIDVCGILPYTDFVGAPNDSFVPYDNRFGIPALCVAGYRTQYDPESGRTYAYPCGQQGGEPSMMMPAGGYFFDSLDRTPDDVDTEGLDPREDYGPSFALLSDEELEFYRKQAAHLAGETDLGVIGNLAPAGFGDAAFLPAPNLTAPRGIRKMTDFIMAHRLRPDYIHGLFAMQLEYALKNLELYRQAVGDSIQAIFMGGTDFGTQRGLMMNAEDFREFYRPYWQTVNDWVHTHTKWKTFYHSCGAVSALIPDFIEAGVDILNPVQCSACGMDAAALKAAYGDRLVFWGGGMDTQHVLPRGTTDEVRETVRERLRIFAPGGGFVFNAIHNIQADTPVENITAMLEEFFACQ